MTCNTAVLQFQRCQLLIMVRLKSCSISYRTRETHRVSRFHDPLNAALNFSRPDDERRTRPTYDKLKDNTSRAESGTPAVNARNKLDIKPLDASAASLVVCLTAHPHVIGFQLSRMHIGRLNTRGHIKTPLTRILCLNVM